MRTLSIVALIVQAAALAACSGQNTTNIPSYVNGDNGTINSQMPPVMIPNDGAAPPPNFSCETTPMATTCGVSFSKDIFPNMKSIGDWKCASAGQCHGNGSQKPLMSDVPDATYTSLVNYTLLGTATRYIQPCTSDTTASGITCNLGEKASCGSFMPLIMDPGTKQVPQPVVDSIAQWIACGAPNN